MDRKVPTFRAYQTLLITRPTPLQTVSEGRRIDQILDHGEAEPGEVIGRKERGESRNHCLLMA